MFFQADPLYCAAQLDEIESREKIIAAAAAENDASKLAFDRSSNGESEMNAPTEQDGHSDPAAIIEQGNPTDLTREAKVENDDVVMEETAADVEGDAEQPVTDGKGKRKAAEVLEDVSKADAAGANDTPINRRGGRWKGAPNLSPDLRRQTSSPAQSCHRIASAPPTMTKHLLPAIPLSSTNFQFHSLKFRVRSNAPSVKGGEDSASLQGSAFIVTTARMKGFRIGNALSATLWRGTCRPAPRR